jgi:hypothetical protein
MAAMTPAIPPTAYALLDQKPGIRTSPSAGARVVRFKGLDCLSLDAVGDQFVERGSARGCAVDVYLAASRPHPQRELLGVGGDVTSGDDPQPRAARGWSNGFPDSGPIPCQCPTSTVHDRPVSVAMRAAVASGS